MEESFVNILQVVLIYMSYSWAKPYGLPVYMWNKTQKTHLIWDFVEILPCFTDLLNKYWTFYTFYKQVLDLIII